LTRKKHILEHRHLEAGLFLALLDDHLEAGSSRNQDIRMPTVNTP
jgi:hypothetical protein